MMTIQELIRNFPKRRVDFHKGDLGHVLVIAGSSGYTGAAYLTSQAAARSGSGLVTLAISESLHGILAAKLTEVMVRPFPETKERSLSLKSEKGLLKFSQKCHSSHHAPPYAVVKPVLTSPKLFASRC